MDYITVSEALRKYKIHLFTLEDLENLFPKEEVRAMRNNLTRWVSKGYFLRLKRDLYEFTGFSPDLRIPDLYVANRLYEPSYVSLETALSFYSIIPEIAANVTCVTTRPTRTFRNKYGAFFYRTCKPRAFTGYRILPYEGFKVNIADKEKALVDFLYFYLRSGQDIDFEQERFNKIILKKIDWKKTLQYAKLFNKKTIKTARKCKEYVKC